MVVHESSHAGHVRPRNAGETRLFIAQRIKSISVPVLPLSLPVEIRLFEELSSLFLWRQVRLLTVASRDEEGTEGDGGSHDDAYFRTK